MLAQTLETLSPAHKFYWLIGGVAGLLFIASVIGYLLKAKLAKQATPNEKSQKILDNLVARVNAWWVMVAVFAVAFLAGKIGAILLFATISYFALREFMTLTPTKAGDHRTLSMAFFYCFRCITTLSISSGMPCLLSSFLCMHFC